MQRLVTCADKCVGRSDGDHLLLTYTRVKTLQLSTQAILRKASAHPRPSLIPSTVRLQNLPSLPAKQHPPASRPRGYQAPLGPGGQFTRANRVGRGAVARLAGTPAAYLPPHRPQDLYPRCAICVRCIRVHRRRGTAAARRPWATSVAAVSGPAASLAGVAVRRRGRGEAFGGCCSRAAGARHRNWAVPRDIRKTSEETERDQ